MPEYSCVGIKALCVCVCVLRMVLGKGQPFSDGPDHLLPGGIFGRNRQWMSGPSLNSVVMLQPLHWTLSTLLPISSPSHHECLLPGYDMTLHSSFSDNIPDSDLCGVSHSGSHPFIHSQTFTEFLPCVGSSSRH